MRHRLWILPLVVLGCAWAVAVVAAGAEEPVHPDLKSRRDLRVEIAGLEAQVAQLEGSVTLFKGRWLEAKRANNAHAAEVRRLRAGIRRLVRSGPFGSHWLERTLLCIKSFEAAWRGRDDATGRTYFGGLQMDRQFQRTYGRVFYEAFGTADRWPVSAQLATGMLAYLSGRGFRPWPNTRKPCGL